MPLEAFGALLCAASGDMELPGPHGKEVLRHLDVCLSEARARQRRADAVETKQAGLWAPLRPAAFQSCSRGFGLVAFPHLSLPLPLTLSVPFPSQTANDLF